MSEEGLDPAALRVVVKRGILSFAWLQWVGKQRYPLLFHNSHHPLVVPSIFFYHTCISFYFSLNHTVLGEVGPTGCGSPALLEIGNIWKYKIFEKNACYNIEHQAVVNIVLWTQETNELSRPLSLPAHGLCGLPQGRKQALCGERGKDCSYIGPRFGFQHPKGGSQPFVTAVPEAPVPSSGLHSHCILCGAQTQHTHKHTPRHPTQKNKHDMGTWKTHFH